jgi:hypothetical protein
MTDWKHELAMASSETRGPVLLEAVQDLGFAEARELVKENWTICEAWGDKLDDALRMLEVVGYIEDDKPLPGDDWLTVYRATSGPDDEPDGGSWTLDLEIAKRFAHMFTSPRAMFVLGNYSEEPVIWRGIVQTSDVLAYFTSRDESEIVVPHGGVWDVEPVMKLVVAEK